MQRSRQLALAIYGLCAMGAGAVSVEQSPSAAAPAPLALPIPVTDSDLNQAMATAASLKKQATACKQCKDNGGEVACGTASSAATQLDDLRIALYGMQDPLQQAALDVVRNMAQVQADYDTLAHRTDTQRRGLAWSKFLSDSAKITLDVISFSDSTLPTLKKVFTDNPAGITSTMSDTQALLAATKMLDSMTEAVTGTISAANDLKAAHVNDSGFMSQTANRMYTLKSGLTDLSNSIGKYLEYSKAISEAQAAAKAAKTAADLGKASAQLAQASKAAAEMRKGIAGIVSKVGGELADYSQAQLAKEIADNEKLMSASDKVLQDSLSQLARIHDRQAKLQQALDAIRDAAAAGYACAASCAGMLGPKPLPAASGQSYGASLRSGNIAVAALVAKLGSHGTADWCTKKKTPENTNAGAKNNCPNGGGLFGNVENVACQIQNSGH